MRRDTEILTWGRTEGNSSEANRTYKSMESIVRHMKKKTHSEHWKDIPWRKLRKNLFRLQRRVWKAIRAGDRKRALNLMKLILRSWSARLLAIRQVSQLNQGKKTAGVDGKKSLTFKERKR